MRHRLAVGTKYTTGNEQRADLAFDQRVALRGLRLEERAFGLARRGRAAALRERMGRPQERGAHEASPECIQTHGCLRTSRTYARKDVIEQANMTIAIGTGPRSPSRPTVTLVSTPKPDCAAPSSDEATPARSPKGAIATEVALEAIKPTDPNRRKTGR